MHGKKPLRISDLRRDLERVFKIPANQQCIVFKGFNLHEYVDEAPLEAFGMENNSPIAVWPRSSPLPSGVGSQRGLAGSPPPNQMLADALNSPRVPPPPQQMSGRWDPAYSSYDSIPIPATNGEVGFSSVPISNRSI